MTVQDTRKILAVLQTAYPHFYRGETQESLSDAVRLWAFMFADDDYAQVSSAVSALISSRSETFPPNIGQVKQMLYKATHRDEMTGAEAWGLVRKAIGRSSYHAAEEHEKLPEEVRACVTPEQLRAWAVDEEFNEPVVMSHFIRSYNEKRTAARDFSLRIRIFKAGR